MATPQTNPSEKAPTPPPAAPETSVGVSSLAAALTEAINATKAKPKITVANRIARNPLNPHNRKRKLVRDFYQNFSLVDVNDLTDEEYELIPKLRPGNFVSDSKQGYIYEVIDVQRLDLYLERPRHLCDYRPVNVLRS